MVPVIPHIRIALRRIAVFHTLPPQDFAVIERAVFPITVNAGSQLLTAGEKSEWVYFIIEGTVRIFRPQRSGTPIILNIVGAGEMLGEICALDQQGHSASAIATETAALYKMRRDEFSALQESLISLSANVKYLLARRLRFCTAHNESLAERRVHQRVARLLLALGNRYATTSGQQSVTIPLRLTQREIADWVRVSRQRAETNIDQLCACGAIEICKGKKYRITIRDCSLLRQHCD